MWKKKKFIIIAAVVAVVLAGSIAGVALAQTGDTTTSVSTNTTQPKTLVARVAQILGIDQQTLQNAVTQAKKDMQNEQIDTYLNNLVANGKITQEQAAQYKTWWQSRPDTTQLQNQIQEQLKQWLQSRPSTDNSTLPGLKGLLGGRGPRGMMRGGMMGGGF